MIIELKNIGKYYINPGTSIRRDVLIDINLELNSGDSIAIVGPSGSGKSTLLNIMGTLDIPTSGEINIKGKAITSMDEKGLAAIRNKTIGFIFQMHHLLPQLNLLDNVLLPILPNIDRKTFKDKSKRAVELLEYVGLADRIHQRPGQLSGGECQRAAVIRALINQPEIILADEPTGSLDQDSAEQVGNLLVKINKDFNIALIVVTHSQTLAEKMGKILRLTKGKLE